LLKAFNKADSFSYLKLLTTACGSRCRWSPQCQVS